MADETELRGKLEEVKRKIMVMQWDHDRNQLNAGRMPIFNELKEEKSRIEQELTMFSQVGENTDSKGADQ